MRRTLYLEKIREYKNRQGEILEEMKRHEVADANFSRARDLFGSSEVDEKRQLLNLVFQNLELKEKTLLIQIHEPFSTIMGYKQCPTNWRWRESNTVELLTF